MTNTPSSSWEERFDEEFKTDGHRLMPLHRDGGVNLYRDVTRFIRETLASERAVLREKIEKMMTNAAEDGFGAEPSDVGHDMALEKVLSLLEPEEGK